jgi:sugar (pentulose or hexulose) kinase
MPERITLYLEQRGQGCPNTRGEVVRTVYEALGFRYRWVLEALERVTGRPINKIYVVGGGSRDAFFCQTVADLTQRPVVAGPAEATLLGNLLVGARAVGALQAPIREVVGASIQTILYLPRDLPGADAAYARFLDLIGRHKDERG